MDGLKKEFTSICRNWRYLITYIPAFPFRAIATARCRAHKKKTGFNTCWDQNTWAGKIAKAQDNLWRWKDEA